MNKKFSRLTSEGAKKSTKAKRQIEREPKVVGETDRDRCVEGEKESLVGEMKE